MTLDIALALGFALTCGVGVGVLLVKLFDHGERHYTGAVYCPCGCDYPAGFQDEHGHLIPLHRAGLEVEG